MKKITQFFVNHPKFWGITLFVVGLNIALYEGLDSALSGADPGWLPGILWGSFGVMIIGLGLMFLGMKIAQNAPED